jgi:tetratricopeptide (TPR) repeat protein
VWAHQLYAGPGYWNPLRPDLLAEQHLADTPQLPTLATAVAQLATGQYWEARVLAQLLAELTRGATNQPAIWKALDELLGAALSGIVGLAVTTDHAELADLASLALQLAPQPALAAELADQMPGHSAQLATLAATLTSQQVTHYRAVPVGEESDAADRLAGSLNNLSFWLNGLRRREEALAASEEAVTIHRELAAAHPQAFRRNLAGSLNNLSNVQAGLGQWEEARAAVEEAVTIRRKLAAAHLQAFRRNLARLLNNLLVRLGGMRRGEEAPVAARPDEIRPELAGSLNNLATVLGVLGRREEALAAIEEAVAIRRELAAARPDVFRPDLAGSLANLASVLNGVG